LGRAGHQHYIRQREFLETQQFGRDSIVARYYVPYRVRAVRARYRLSEDPGVLMSDDNCDTGKRSTLLVEDATSNRR
jgi:hypothetical protein